LRTNCVQHRVAILGYCLLTNHVHRVAIAERPDGLARALGETHGVTRNASTGAIAAGVTCGRTAFVPVL